MRKLATIRQIADIQPIPGADAIEVATVDGWNVVVKKGEFKVNDLAVYFEIDSVLPIRPEFEFLRKGCYVKKDWLVSEQNPTGEGFRLKTIRLRGQVSQGLLVPVPVIVYDYLDTYGVGDDFNYFVTKDHTDADVSDFLGVVKWDPPLPATLSGCARGNFPSFIPKTDQERIQNISQRDLDKYLDDDFEITLKLDGSSMTAYVKDGKVGVCSRNLELDYENSPDTTFAQVFINSGLKDFLEFEVDNVAIQGELMGPGIQGNQEGLKEHTFFIFDIYDIAAGRYLNSDERGQFINDMIEWQPDVGVQHCPVLAYRYPVLQRKDKAEILKMADGPSLNAAAREGLVFKSIQNPHFSFKAISNKWLLGGGE